MLIGNFVVLGENIRADTTINGDRQSWRGKYFLCLYEQEEYYIISERSNVYFWNLLFSNGVSMLKLMMKLKGFSVLILQKHCLLDVCNVILVTRKHYSLISYLAICNCNVL
jgi:hypothetical protein